MRIVAGASIDTRRGLIQLHLDPMPLPGPVWFGGQISDYVLIAEHQSDFRRGIARHGWIGNYKTQASGLVRQVL